MGQNASNSCSKRPQKTYKSRFSDTFSYSWAHINFPKNQYLDLICKELCGIMATIVAKNNVECRHFCDP